MKSEKFVADKSYDDKWQGEYEIKAISAADHIEIEEEIVKYIQKQGKDPTVQDFPINYYRALGVMKSTTKDGKLLGSSVEELLKLVPNRLYQILLTIHIRLNEPSEEEARFLSKK